MRLADCDMWEGVGRRSRRTNDVTGTQLLPYPHESQRDAKVGSMSRHDTGRPRERIFFEPGRGGRLLLNTAPRHNQDGERRTHPGLYGICGGEPNEPVCFGKQDNLAGKLTRIVVHS